VLPANLPSKDVVCRGCHRRFRVSHATHGPQ
jgi:hypothetical protein